MISNIITALIITGGCAHAFSPLSSSRPVYVQLSAAVKVYDEIFSASYCKLIDEEASAGGLGHSLYLRSSYPPKTFVEIAIENILKTMNDNSPIVEYWWRDEWLSLELHRDVDEKLAQRDKVIRFPTHGHVLYLSVGDEVCGPTIILHEPEKDNKTDNKSQFNRITIVPSVQGRLLRFQGDLMHAVPRPELAYLDPSEGGSNLEIWTRRRQIDSGHRPDRRSVLLFNTWSDEPPLDIPSCPPTASLEIHNNVHKSKSTDITDNVIQHDDIITQPFHLWKEREIVTYEHKGGVGEGEGERTIRLKIGLLGDSLRRERINSLMS
eukprot:gene7705-15770_t